MENDRHLVSIITPLYNSEKYISQAIESVQQQSYQKWELLIIDDCSTDNSVKVVKKYLGNSHIKLLKMDVNSGGARARNKGLENAKGRFITFLDADDMWKPDRLEKQINFAITNNYGFTFSGYEIMYKPKNKIVKVPHVLDYESYFKNTIIAMMTVLIDRAKIGNIQFVDIRKDHDSMTWAKILRQGHKAYGLNESLAYYRKVTGSISNNKLEAVKNHWNNCRKIEKIPFLTCCYYFIFYIGNAVKKNLL